MTGLSLVLLFIVACGTTPPHPVTTQPEVVEPRCGPQRMPRIIEHPEFTPSEEVRIIRTDYVGEDQCIRVEGFLSPQCVQVRVEQDGVSWMIASQEELRDWFAPVESADEALTYALLATGYTAKYAPEDYRLAVGDVCDPGPDHYYYYTDVLEDTHVTEVSKGYQVNLFYGEKTGCGPFPVSSVTVEVNLDGAISELSKVKLYEQGKPCPGEKVVQCCVD